MADTSSAKVNLMIFLMSWCVFMFVVYEAGDVPSWLAKCAGIIAFLLVCVTTILAAAVYARLRSRPPKRQGMIRSPLVVANLGFLVVALLLMPTRELRLNDFEIRRDLTFERLGKIGKRRVVVLRDQNNEFAFRFPFALLDSYEKLQRGVGVECWIKDNEVFQLRTAEKVIHPLSFHNANLAELPRGMAMLLTLAGVACVLLFENRKYDDRMA